MIKILIELSDDEILTSDEVKFIEKHHGTKLTECNADDCISRKAAIKGLGEQPCVWTDSDYEIQQLNDWKSAKAMLESLSGVYPKSDDSILEDIKTEIESINNWSIRYAPAEDKDKRAQIVAKVKKHIISIVDKHISGKEQ